MMCRMLRDDFGGEIPDTIEELVKLPGSEERQLIL